MATTGKTRVLPLDVRSEVLDPTTGEFVLELTKTLARDRGPSAIMVTHSMVLALLTWTRTIVFHRGSIVFDAEGPERDAMLVSDRRVLFKRKQSEELAAGSLLPDRRCGRCHVRDPEHRLR